MTISYIQKTILQNGDDQHPVRKYDEVAIEYTGEHWPSHINVYADNIQDGCSERTEQTGKAYSKLGNAVC